MICVEADSQLRPVLGMQYSILFRPGRSHLVSVNRAKQLVARRGVYETASTIYSNYGTNYCHVTLMGNVIGCSSNGWPVPYVHQTVGLYLMFRITKPLTYLAHM